MNTILKLTSDQDCRYIYIPLINISMFRELHCPDERSRTEIRTMDGETYCVTERASYIRKHYDPPKKKYTGRDHHNQHEIPKHKKEQK